MKRIEVVILVALATTCGQNRSAAQTSKLPIDCATMAAITVDSNSQFLVQADVPALATNERAEFQVRLAGTGQSWKTCQQGTSCNGAALPTLKRTPLPDGSIHYSGYVTMGGGIVGTYVMGKTTFVRLVTRYQSISATCQAQASVTVPLGGSYELSIHLPAGSKILGISTYWRPLDSIGYLEQGTSFWERCDDWTPPPLIAGQNTVGKVCGGHQRSPQHVLFGYVLTTDPGDNAVVLGPIGCVDEGTGNPLVSYTNPQGCRVVISYQ